VPRCPSSSCRTADRNDQSGATVEVEAGEAAEFQWNDLIGFYPAGSNARIVANCARSLQVLWQRDSLCWNVLEQVTRSARNTHSLEPFRDSLIAINGKFIADELEGGAPDSLLIEGLTTAIAVKIERHFSEDSVRVDAGFLSHQRVRRITEFVEAHLGDQVTLDAVAKVACLSPYHLSRSFKHATGIGLHRYVVLRRIARAKEFMLRTKLPLAEIAMAVGFETQAAFSTRFRRETGVTPMRFREHS
jgi:AraC-like DNA-binding protein